MASDRSDKASIRKLTPLERAIAEQKDRRRKWDAKQEQAGFVRTSIMVHKDGLAEVKALVQRINADARRGERND